MRFRFRIQNFQSIIDQTFDLEGFIAISGGSNLGKSAVVRALRAFFYNEMSLTFIREGAAECMLIGEWLDPNPLNIKGIVFRRASSINSYTIYFNDGTDKIYNKIGKETPVELKSLGFRLLETERLDRFNLNFQGQLESLFLVTEQEVALTSFLNAIFGVDKYERALRAINTDILQGQKEFDGLSKLNLELVAQQEIEFNQAQEAKLNLEFLNGVVQQVILLEEKLNVLENGLIKAQWVMDFDEQWKEIQRKRMPLLGWMLESKNCERKLKSHARLVQLLDDRQSFLLQIFNIQKRIDYLSYPYLACLNAHQGLAKVEKMVRFFSSIENIIYELNTIKGYREDILGSQDSLRRYKNYIWTAVQMCPTCGKPLS